MKVKIAKPIVGINEKGAMVRWNVGDIVDVPKEQAEAMLSNGRAVAPDAPETAAVEPARTAMRRPGRPRKARAET